MSYIPTRSRRRRVGVFSLRMLYLSFLLIASMLCAAWAQDEEDAMDAQDDETIVITQDDVDAMISDQGEEQTTDQQGRPTLRAMQQAGMLPDLEAAYGFPSRQYIYRDWLNTPGLNFLVPIENRIREQEAEYRRMMAGRPWSEGLQRDLDLLEDEIGKVETEREQALRDRIAELETSAGLSPDQRSRDALLNMALALNFMDEGKAKQALDVLARAARDLPDEPLVHALIGAALREVGQNAAAREELRTALNGQPHLLLALVTLAEVNEDELNYEAAAELWDRARQARANLPEGEGRLPSGFSDRFVLRMRMARLHDFAKKYYEADDRAGYRLVYDPSLGVLSRNEVVVPLKEAVDLYLEGGERAIDPARLDRLFVDLNRERDPDAFRVIVSRVSDSLEAAMRDLSRQLPRGRSARPIVVLYNPDVWETLIASRQTLGSYAPHGGVISLYLTGRMNPNDLRNTVYHEYAHFLTFDVTGPRELPLWLVEGLAEYLALESGYDRFGADSTMARWRDIWAKDAVERPWFNKGHEDFTDADSFKARRAVAVLARAFGPNGLGAFLEALGDGADLNEASIRAFRMDYRELLQFIIRRLPTLIER